MKKFLFLLAGVCLFASSRAQTQLERSFEGIEVIEMSVGSGDAYFEKGSDQSVSFVLKHDIDGYDPIIEQRGRKLVIKEENQRGNWGYRGSSSWSFKVPDDIKIEFNTGSGDVLISDLTVTAQMNSGSGDFEMDKVNGDFQMNTGSGDFEIKDAQGDFQINTGSGDVDIRSSEISIQVNTGSGSVEARDLTLSGSCDFNAGSGDVEITLSAPLDHDIALNSGSGDAILDFDGNKIEGMVVMKVNKKNGRIKAPFQFDKEEEINDGGRRNVVLKKSAKIGEKDVRIAISSGSGTAEIIE